MKFCWPYLLPSVLFMSNMSPAKGRLVEKSHEVFVMDKTDRIVGKKMHTFFYDERYVAMKPELPGNSSLLNLNKLQIYSVKDSLWTLYRVMPYVL